jgi:segregation and condensation protein B
MMDDPAGEGDGGTEQLEVADRNLRIVEALLFASAEPLAAEAIAVYLDEGADAEALLAELAARYAGHGVNLVRRGDKWAFRTAEDLGFLLRR